jgi:hypothetical protein
VKPELLRSLPDRKLQTLQQEQLILMQKQPEL